MITLVNLGAEPFEVTRGMRIAQMVVARVERVTWRAVDTLPGTTRGAGGFGSTGR
jgi:dUTP pyrophosphatase